MDLVAVPRETTVVPWVTLYVEDEACATGDGCNEQPGGRNDVDTGVAFGTYVLVKFDPQCRSARPYHCVGKVTELIDDNTYDVDF